MEGTHHYYKAADVLAMPTREDICGLVINEALSYGLPVVSTNKCIAALELVSNGKNGYIIPAENDNAIAEVIDKVLSMKYDGFGLESYNRIKNILLKIW